MSTIYDRRANEFKGESLVRRTESVAEDTALAAQQKSRPAKDSISESKPYKDMVQIADDTDIAGYENNANTALGLVDDVVLKNYLTRLPTLEIVPAEDKMPLTDTIVYKVNKMVYEKDEYATDKFISIISAMTYTASSVFMIVDGHKDHTDFYLGIKCEDSERTASSVASTFVNAMTGQFPGVQLTDMSTKEPGAERSMQDHLIHKMTEATAISICTGIPAQRNSQGEYTNATFVQGIEKFAAAMQGKEYTAVVVAKNMPAGKIADVRFQYETISSAISIYETQHLSMTSNESLSRSVANTIGDSITRGSSHTEGVSSSRTHTTSHTEGSSESHTSGISYTKGFNKSFGVSFILSDNNGFSISKTRSASDTFSKNQSDTSSDSSTKGESQSDTTSVSGTQNKSETSTISGTTGASSSITVDVKDKHIQEVLKRIDKQLERISLCESTGLWSASAYFLSYGTDRATAETGATIFRSLMQGEQSGIERSAVNTWHREKTAFPSLREYVCGFAHPLFIYPNALSGRPITVSPTTLMSSREVALMLGLPRKSVPGFPVVEHVSLGKEVARHSVQDIQHDLPLGCIYDQGIERHENKVLLDANSLTQHTFVTGSTGCGKSETVYKLIHEAKRAGATVLIVEPAKGEYKKVFGDVNVFGTNPKQTPLLRINPFRFPKDIHVLEHIDRLTEIFNVCWPMYAAMPAVLKKAMLKSYENCGWDLYHSVNKHSDDLFPSFDDLLIELEKAINASAYSDEVKGNYTGSLVTRVESLTNGINGEIFSANELSDTTLFDENTIIDLSRIGSQETKSLIMGILIMRLNEYRMVSDIEANAGLRHITVLEEAHNILKRTSTEQSMEGANVMGKSVEMITNAIAEMRTYGEGFIIVDQSPTSVDPAAIKNTNTKIIMRLPDGDDREVAGKAAAMKDYQIDEIAKLPTGVAVVYQNDWECPVLCKIQKYDGDRIKYIPKKDSAGRINDKNALSQVIRFLIKGRVSNPEQIEVIDNLKNILCAMRLPNQLRLTLIGLVSEYQNTSSISLWKDEKFPELARIVTQLLGLRPDVEKAAAEAKDFNDLNNLLDVLIRSKVDTFESMNFNLRQCLMEDWGEGNETRRHITNVWEQEFRSSLRNL